MSVHKLLLGGLVAAVIAVNGLLIPTTVQATSEVLGLSVTSAVISQWQMSGGALHSVKSYLGIDSVTTTLTDTVTDTITNTITSTLPVTVPSKIPDAISRYFSGTVTVAASDVISLHVSGMGFGEIFKMYQLALLSGKTPDEILALRKSGMGWGQISHQLSLSPGNKGNNLGAAVSGRGVATQPISGTVTTDTGQKNKPATDESVKPKGPPVDKGKPDTAPSNNGKGNDSGGPPGKSKGK